MDFKERLKQFRENLGFESKREFSKELGVSENVYYMTENGTRKPSKNFLASLVCYSNKPTEYWLYGVKKESKYLDTREEYKMLKYVLDSLKESFKTKKEFDEDAKQMILIAAKADLEHILKKEKEGII